MELEGPARAGLFDSGPGTVVVVVEELLPPLSTPGEVDEERDDPVELGVGVEVEPAGGLTTKLLPITTTTSAASEEGSGDPTSSMLVAWAAPELALFELVTPETPVPDVTLGERPVPEGITPGL